MGWNQEKDNPMYGKHHTEETKEKLRKKLKGKTWKELYGIERANEIKNKFIESRKGYRHSDTTKIKIGQATKRRFEDKKNTPMYGKHHTEETKRKMSEANKGKKFTEEHKIKLSESLKGRNNTMKGLTFIEVYGEEKANEIKEKISIGHKGEKCYIYGKHCSLKTREKMSESRKGKLNPMYGKTHSIETKEKWSKEREGKNNANWLGGKSFEPYSYDFNNKIKKIIKERDGKCMLCKVNLLDLKLLKRRICVHHIDYDKKNSFPQNLIILCMSCHMITNNDRSKWTSFFHKLLLEEYKYEYTEDQKIILDFIKKEGDFYG